jgi:hypothetical protein
VALAVVEMKTMISFNVTLCIFVKMSSEISMTLYQIARHHIPEDRLFS